MPKKFTIKNLKEAANKFCNCKTTADLEMLLEVSKKELALFSILPEYYTFNMLKKDGSYRTIEAPAIELKRLQRKLNFYLQSVYYFIKPKAPYGYIISPRGDKDPRNIVTNAQFHVNCKYMLNIDFEDFFHQVNQKKVFQQFSEKPFSFDKKTAHLLSKLCTYKNRLPMGAPTSPALSNFSVFNFDITLQKWANDNELKYTRFVDDITLSSAQKIIGKNHLNQIDTICRNHDLKLNAEKTKFFKPGDLKTVTGLVVTGDVTIHPDYYNELDEDMERLKRLMEVDIITGHLHKGDMIKKFKQEVMGKVNFISIVRGKNSGKHIKYLNLFDEALNPPENELSVRWINFSYIDF